MSTENIRVSGQFFTEQSSACQVVEVVLDMAYTLHIFDEHNRLIGQYDYAQLNIADKIGSVPREITIPQVGLLIIASASSSDKWLSKQGKYDKASKLERSKGWVIGSIVAVPAFLYLFFAFIVPVAAIAFADMVPDRVVKITSQHTLMALDSKITGPSEIDENERRVMLERMVAVIEQLETTNLHFDIQFRKSELMGANAFALPDGTIVFTDDFIDLVEGDIDLLIAVLLHEIGHVEHKHSMRLIAETLATALAVDFFLGDLGALVEFFAGVTNTVVQNQFSQELEWEADNYALEQLQLIGRSPDDFAKAMEKLSSGDSESNALEKYLSSHPSIKDRIMNAKQEGSQD